MVALRVRVVLMAFLLSVLEILLIQLTLTNREADRWRDRDRDRYVVFHYVACLCSGQDWHTFYKSMQFMIHLNNQGCT